ncbi:MAG: DUF2802 domain-containing protein [Azonexus sp.]|nr:DUF2802 domain-containing protein [Azonexus sp.]
MIGTSLPTVEIAGVTLGLREGIFVVVGLVAVYMALVLWRMRRLLGRDDAPPPTPERTDVPSPRIDTTDDEPVLEDVDDTPAPVPPVAIDATQDRQPAQWSEDLVILREEVDMLRSELAALREDMHQELAHLRASQTVSPIYGDAMQMASAGYDAAMIAERCGIARAEAELVVALTKSELQ